MRKENNFLLCTIKELAQHITDKIHMGNNRYLLTKDFYILSTIKDTLGANEGCVSDDTLLIAEFLR